MTEDAVVKFEEQRPSLPERAYEIEEAVQKMATKVQTRLRAIQTHLVEASYRERLSEAERILEGISDSVVESDPKGCYHALRAVLEALHRPIVFHEGLGATPLEALTRAAQGDMLVVVPEEETPYE